MKYLCVGGCSDGVMMGVAESRGGDLIVYNRPDFSAPIGPNSYIPSVLQERYIEMRVSEEHTVYRHEGLTYNQAMRRLIEFYGPRIVQEGK